MFTADNYIVAKSVEEAYELNKAKNSTVIGGMLWLKMANKKFKNIIDLRELNLDKIEETEDEIHIGSTVTLRQLETSEILKEHFDNAFKECLKHIVGVQFRNCATIGGSVYGRFGFSDVITLLMSLDCYVKVYPTKIIPISQYVQNKPENEIIEKIIIKKHNYKVSYQTQRHTKTDFPILALSVSKFDDKLLISIGGRPMKAVLVENHLEGDISDEQIKSIQDYIEKNIAFGSNMRASAEYRKVLAKVFVKRAIENIGG